MARIPETGLERLIGLRGERAGEYGRVVGIAQRRLCDGRSLDDIGDLAVARGDVGGEGSVARAWRRTWLVRGCR